ncbi:hypothetical protein [Kineosporia sp. A_224]|uniref:hypothetical protein n=1 Tax=Kineosporia sp. A_224 TaxID=1962180 RepID=UPI00117A24A9|nr:hypothetical protein [Kineosporia sp. A_224]
MKPDGTVDRATALAAFSTAIGPVPGAPTVTDAPGVRASGTAAVWWTLAHWRELDDAQQGAVRGALLDRHIAPAAFVAAGAADPDLPCSTADSPDAGRLRPTLDAAVSDIAGRLGRSLRIPVHLTMNRAQRENHPDGSLTVMYTYPCRGTGTADGTRPTGCTIHVNPHAFDTTFSDADRSAFLVHEAMHCYVLDLLGPAAENLAPWLQEGIPMWVQVALRGGDAKATEKWYQYLEPDRRSLFGRSYDAIGFYAQLAGSGADVWSRIDPMLRGFGAGGNAAAWRASSARAAFLRGWAPGTLHGRRQGAAWDITGYGIPPARPSQGTARQLAAGDTVVAKTPAAGVDVVSLVLPADAVLLLTATGKPEGLLGSADGDHPVPDLLTAPVCTAAAGCTCPEGSPAAGVRLPGVAAGPADLAITGGLARSTVTVTVSTLADHCAQPPQCLPGTWTMTGSRLALVGGVSETGGAGAVLRIEADGTAAASFDPMQPVTFRARQGLAGTLQYDGTARYRLKLPPENDSTGTIGVGVVDLDRVRVTVKITSPFEDTVFDHEPLGRLARSFGSGVHLDGRPLGSAHSFKCTASTLTLIADGADGVTGTWSFRRSS